MKINEPITKQQLLEKIRQSRAEWESFLSRLDEDQLIKPGASGEWSVKDIIAHLNWHEREMIAVIQTHALAGSDLWNLPLDPGRFPGMLLDWQPWDLLASNTYEHYASHLPQIQAMIK